MLATAGIASAGPDKPDVPDVNTPCSPSANPERPVDCSGFVYCLQVTPWSMLCEGNVIGFVKYIVDHVDPGQLINPNIINPRA